MRKANQKLITPEIFRQAIIGSFVKLNPPLYDEKNPRHVRCRGRFSSPLILSFSPTLFGDQAAGNVRTYNIIVSVILFITVLFANFAESVAEGRGKGAGGQPEKRRRKDTKARLLKEDGYGRDRSFSQLKKGRYCHGVGR